MSKILLVIQREYISKVTQRSFWVMAFLGPLLFAVAMVVPLWTGMQQEARKVIQVVDHSGLMKGKLIPTPGLGFVFTEKFSPSSQRDPSHDFYALLLIPEKIADSAEVFLYSGTDIAPDVKLYLEKNLTDVLSAERLKRAGIDYQVVQKSFAPVKVQSKKWDVPEGDQPETAASLVIAMFSAVLILFFIVLYGGQVMRGVMEEKTNRIVEVMISSVKPFELMMGKIIGIALLSLTQFLFWISLTYAISSVIQSRYEKVFQAFSGEHIEQTLKNNPQLNAEMAMEMNHIISAIDSIDFIYQLFVFLIYFLGGYLLYAAMFAGIGSAIDSETDTQQFVFPLIAPLMLVMFVATKIVAEPDGKLAFWLSMIPFTSPVAMMLRLPFEVPLWQLILSVLLLLITFTIVTWLSSRVYRVGILMYGKKASFAELGKWMFRK